MDEAFLVTFPYPYRRGEKEYDGLDIKWPERCGTCAKTYCHKHHTPELASCAYGFNYVWVDKEMLVAGIVVRDYYPVTQAHKKQAKKMAHCLIEKKKLMAVLERLREAEANSIGAIERKKMELLERYKNKELYTKDILQEIEPRIRQAFSSLHDYKHFVSQVSQNINVILEYRYPEIPLDEKLETALHAEKAIYYASKLMSELLNVSLYVTNPRFIDDISDISKFSLHGLVLKYLRIYQMAFDEAGIKVRVMGKSDGKIVGNPKAISIIPHTFIHNALKYSQGGSEVRIIFREEPDEIRLSVQSYGPRIADDESEKIFEPFYRARDARRQEEEGTGFGLYAARFVARHLSTDVEVEQAQTRTDKGHLTTFSVTLPREE